MNQNRFILGITSKNFAQSTRMVSSIILFIVFITCGSIFSSQVDCAELQHNISCESKDNNPHHENNILFIDILATEIGHYSIRENPQFKTGHPLVRFWFPVPHQDETDRLDFWGNRWRWNPKFGFIDRYGNTIPKQVVFDSDLGSQNKPIIDKNNVAWIFSFKCDCFYEFDSSFPKTRKTYPGSNWIPTFKPPKEQNDTSFVEPSDIYLLGGCVRDGLIFYDGWGHRWVFSMTLDGWQDAQGRQILYRKNIGIICKIGTF
jgi:hypothetical protein